MGQQHWEDACSSCVLCRWGFCCCWSSLGSPCSQDWLEWGDMGCPMGWQSPAGAGQG